MITTNLISYDPVNKKRILASRANARTQRNVCEAIKHLYLGESVVTMVRRAEKSPGLSLHDISAAWERVAVHGPARLIQS